MDFAISETLSRDLEKFKLFLKDRVKSKLPEWYRHREIPLDFFREMGSGGWYGIAYKSGALIKGSALREALIAEELARLSPGLAVAALVQIDLGLIALLICGSDHLKARYGEAAASGETLMCVGNTEQMAGSDSAGIEMHARKVKDGWLLNGTKAYVTNGYISDLGVMTAVSDTRASRNERISMFLVDLHARGVKRKKAQQTGLDPLRFDPPAVHRCFCAR